MKTKIQIKSYWGSVLFEHEGENNTIKQTVEKAVKNGASLVGASLDRASLDRASLDGASLVGASLSWTSHDLLAEILRWAAKDDIEKLKIVGLILLKRDWCWKEFLALNDPLKSWVLSELAKWVKDDAPNEIKQILNPYRDEKKV